MNLIVRAFPLLGDDVTALEEFAEQLRDEKSRETRDFYARYGVARETWHVQQTPSGPWVIGVTELDGRG